MSNLFNIAIATIFAREVLEASVIIGNYRTVINKSDYMDEATKKENLRAVTMAASFSALVAIVVVLAVAIPLGILSSEFDQKTGDIIEGVSKVIASVCVLQLSLKIPLWLGVYRKSSIIPCKKQKPASTEEEKNIEERLTVKEIRFNVAWNIWREVAECGVFLIPFFLGSNGASAIPLSALAGGVLSLFIGVGIYIANNRLNSKTGLSIFMAGLTLFLAVGLFVGGIHEFEEHWPNGESRSIYELTTELWSSDRLPMVLLKPFGYSWHRSLLQITTFWLSLALGCTLHYLKYRATQKIIENESAAGEGFSQGQKSLNDETDVESPITQNEDGSA